jgi:aminoglycoside/choline kinase family phosphotransferase
MIGNNAVHSGVIDTDDRYIANSLFDLVNLIVDERITRSQKLQPYWNSLPQKERDIINRRDGRT